LLQDMGALAALAESAVMSYKLIVTLPTDGVQEPLTPGAPTSSLHSVMGLLLVGLRVMKASQVSDAAQALAQLIKADAASALGSIVISIPSDMVQLAPLSLATRLLP
jgi:hypothetical protein